MAKQSTPQCFIPMKSILNLLKNYVELILNMSTFNETRHMAIRHLRYFSVSKDVSDTIAQTATLNTTVSGHTTDITALQTATPSVDAITLNFTVQTTSPGRNRYFLNGEETPFIELLKGHKYIFTFPAAHPLKLSPDEDGGPRDPTTGVSLGNAEYTNGVTYDSSTQLTFSNTFMSTFFLTNILYYYCENHADMGENGAIFEQNGLHKAAPRGEINTTFIPIALSHL